MRPTALVSVNGVCRSFCRWRVLYGKFARLKLNMFWKRYYNDKTGHVCIFSRLLWLIAYIYTSSILCSTQEKILGIYLDSKMSWESKGKFNNSHCDNKYSMYRYIRIKKKDNKTILVDSNQQRTVRQKQNENIGLRV